MEPHARNSELNRAERDRQTAALTSRPQRVVLELSNKCNLRCKHCAISHNAFNQTLLTMDLFEKVWPLVQTAREVTLFGYGEPLLNPNFRAIFERCAAIPGITTYFTTNGILLNTVAETLVRNRLTFLGISVDGATDATYSAIRRGTQGLERVVKNIHLINRLKAQYESRHPALRFAFVGMRDNIHELPALVQLAIDLKLDGLKFNYLVAHTEEMKQQVLWYQKETARAYMREAFELARRHGLHVDSQPIFGEAGHHDFHRPCYLPWEDLFVGSDGLVRPCMISNDILGDLHRASFDEIWNDSGFQEFRQRVNGPNPPDDCKTCFQCRHMDIDREDTHLRLEINVANAPVTGVDAAETLGVGREMEASLPD